jgi:hypothetical protein
MADDVGALGAALDEAGKEVGLADILKTPIGLSSDDLPVYLVFRPAFPSSSLHPPFILPSGTKEFHFGGTSRSGRTHKKTAWRESSLARVRQKSETSLWKYQISS